MQAFAVHQERDFTLPEGCVPFFEVEEAIRRLVFTRIVDLPTEFSGNPFTATFTANPHPLRLRRISKVPHAGKVMHGIVAHIMDFAIWPQFPDLTGTEHVVLVGQGECLDCDPTGLFALDEPTTAPVRCWTVQDACSFIDYGIAHDNDRVFIDPEFWAIRNAPNTRTSLCDHHDQLVSRQWEKVRQHSGMFLAFRVPSERKNRPWKSASEIAKALKNRIDFVFSNKLPRLGTPEDRLLERFVIQTFSAIPDEDKPKMISHRAIVTMLGLDPERDQDLKAVRRYYKKTVKFFGL